MESPTWNLNFKFYELASALEVQDQSMLALRVTVSWLPYCGLRAAVTVTVTPVHGLPEMSRLWHKPWFSCPLAPAGASHADSQRWTASIYPRGATTGNSSDRCIGKAGPVFVLCKLIGSGCATAPGAARHRRLRKFLQSRSRWPWQVSSCQSQPIRVGCQLKSQPWP